MRFLHSHRSLFAAPLALGALALLAAACSGPPAASSTVPLVRSPQSDLRVDASRHGRAATSGDAYAFFFNGQGNSPVEVAAYPRDRNTPSIAIGGEVVGGNYLSPVSGAVDHAGNLYVASYAPGSVRPSVWVFAPGSSKPKYLITRGIAQPYAFAFDKSDNLYVANGYAGGNTIAVYAPGQTIPKYVITDGLCDPYAMAFDRRGNLYVANATRNGTTGANVTVYRPGQTAAYAVLQTGYGSKPLSLAFGPAGDLYVADPSLNVVSVFAPGKTVATSTIKSGVSTPVYVVVDGSGTLYVANAGTLTGRANSRGTISVFAAGKTSPSYLIPPPPGCCAGAGFSAGPGTQMAFDHAGNLYAAVSFSEVTGAGQGGIPVYRPGATTPSYVITWPWEQLQNGIAGLAVAP